MTRHDGRADDALRKVDVDLGFLKRAAGSVLFSMGETRVLCAASVENRIPPFLNGSGEGWVTGEYAMLPASTSTRKPREARRGRPAGRTMEIQRLIGRALRSVVDRKALGERTLWIDCDVIQADGGTRTASVTGGFIAMAVALAGLQERGLIKGPVLTGTLAAVSVGIVEGRTVLDLDYIEDAAAEVDMNIIRTDAGKYVEIQGTAEGAPFGREGLNDLLSIADKGIDGLLAIQKETIGQALDNLVIPS